MANAPDDAHVRAQAGMSALREGDAARARRHFETAVSTGRADASTWHGLAVACMRLADSPSMLAALDKALEVDGRHLPSLFMKAEHYAAIGEDRAALSYFGVVLALAEQSAAPSPELIAMAQRAQSMKRMFVAKMASHLLNHVRSAGYDKETSSVRFTHALDLLTGAKQVYLQEPRSFYFPELPNIQFYGRETLPWIEKVEAATPAITAELREILKSESEFTPYIQSEPDRPIEDSMGLMDKPDWTAFFLWKDGEPIQDNIARCPATMAALADVPLTRIKGRAPSILFSRLLPGARIPPHHGFLNTRLICHLPLIAPQGNLFRVGNETRHWEPGRAWAFDDTIEHEAVNSSKDVRVILIFEIWKPELTSEERKLVASLVEAVDLYAGGAQTRWEQ